MVTLVDVGGVIRLQRVFVMQLPIPLQRFLREYVAGNQLFQPVAGELVAQLGQTWC